MATDTTVRSASDHASDFTSKQRTIALVVVALAFVMDLLDSTIVNIAIPSIQSNLHASYSAIQWLIAGYMLSFATLLITGGRMGDVYGYKKLFMAGVAGFTIASLLSGLAWNPGVLIAARLLQGAMAALMVPQVMSMMQVMYSKQERGQVMGLFGALGGLAATLGPIVGGILINADIAGLHWRPIFLINVPIGLFAFIAAMRVLPNGKSEHPLKLDIVGTFVIIAAMVAVIFPLVEGRDLGWPIWGFVMMATSIPLLLIFAWYERRKMAYDGSPLVVPSLFKTRTFVTGLTVNFAFEMLFIGFFLINTLMLQAGLGYSVIRAALTGIPFAVGIGLSIGVFGQKLLPKLGRYVIAVGVILVGIGYVSTAVILNHYHLDTHSWQLLGPMLVAGLGAGLIMTPIFSVVLMDVDVQHAGSASGILNAIQQVGGAVGVALIGVIFFGLLAHGADTATAKVSGSVESQLVSLNLPLPAIKGITQQFQTCFHDRSNEKDASVIPRSCVTTPNADLPDAANDKIAGILAEAGRQANADNFVRAFSWGIAYEVALLLLVLGLSFLLPRYIRNTEADVAV